jgi:hypothetical protein
VEVCQGTEGADQLIHGQALGEVHHFVFR